MRPEDIVQPGGYPRSAITYNGVEFWILSYTPQQRSQPSPVYSQVPGTTSAQPPAEKR